MDGMCIGGFGTNQMNGAPAAHPPVALEVTAEENGVRVLDCHVCGHSEIQFLDDDA